MKKRRLKFKEWLKLKEVTTSTGDIASFKNIVGGVTNFRMYPDPITFGDDNDKKKKKRNR
jgi:hypothetical protein